MSGFHPATLIGGSKTVRRCNCAWLFVCIYIQGIPTSLPMTAGIRWDTLSFSLRDTPVMGDGLGDLAGNRSHYSCIPAPFVMVYGYLFI